jgi:diguanylate cyclase (GGDEF)-like protein/PAS domain S-box-containing protein
LGENDGKIISTWNLKFILIQPKFLSKGTLSTIVKTNCVHIPRMFLIIQLFVFFTCSSVPFFPHSNSETAAAPLQTVVLQLKWTHQFQFAGYYAALDKGFYKQAGLDVQIVEGSSNLDPAQQVLQGKATFGIATSDLVLWKAKGFPVVSLAAIYQHSPLVILGNPKNGVTNIHELAGKNLMLESQNAEILAYLKNEKVPVERVTILPYAFSPEAFANGSIDATSAYLTDEPFELNSRNIDYYVMNPRSSGVDFYGDCLFTTQSVIQHSPEMVKAFVKASLLGWQYALANTNEMVDLIQNRYHSTHSRDHLIFEAEQSRGLIMDDVVELGYQNPGRWKRIAETYAELGQMPGIIDLSSFVYDPNPPPNLTGLYLILISVFAVMLITTYIAGRFYRLNKAFKREMTRREEMETLLRQMESRYRTLVENAPFPIIISSVNKAVGRYINQQAANLFEIARDFAVGRPVGNFYENPDDRQKMMVSLKNSGYMKNWEVRLKKGTGEGFWANVSATQIPFDGEDSIFVAVVDITERKEMERKLVDLAHIDSLTGIYSRGYFMERATEEITRAVRYKLSLTLLMVDVDFFKSINDTFGHAAGDQVLIQLSTAMKNQTRTSDLVGRIGGEEFGILLLNTNMEAALVLAVRLRKEIQDMMFISGSNTIKVTISIGVAELNADIHMMDQLMNAADQALYEAKGGRNRVSAYKQHPHE